MKVKRWWQKADLAEGVSRGQGSQGAVEPRSSKKPKVNCFDQLINKIALN